MNSNSETNGLTYSFSGGADDSLFNLNSDTGLVTFISAPDYENPSDSGADNDYNIRVTVTDAGSLSDVQDITISVTDVAENTAPTITSSATASVAENQTGAIDVQATDDNGGLTYGLSGGADQGLFDINSSTGLVTFINAPDYEIPSDAGADNDYEIQVTVTDAGGLTDVQDIIITVTDVNENTGSSDLYFSLNRNNSNIVSGARDEDIIFFDGTDFSLYFDGSDVGVGGEDINAIDIISNNEILVSFTTDGTVNGITFDDSDILKFTATSLGTNTSGTFEMYFDGSQVGLSSNGEDIDGLTLLDNGDLLISTTGRVSVTGVSGADEDILLFNPTSLGANTSGTWSSYFDGSDVGLSSSSEDVNALAISNDQRHLSTSGDVTATGVSGSDEDVLVFNPNSLGSNTSGSYESDLFFDGSAYPLDSRDDIFAIDLNIGTSSVPTI